MAAVINFGITPSFSFGDVSADIVGEGVELSSNIVVDLSAIEITISASVLNAMIDETPSGTVSLSGGASLLTSDIRLTQTSASHSTYSRLRNFVEFSYKGTIANALFSDPTADIGGLETADALSGETIVTNTTIDDLRQEIHSSINGELEAVLVAAEDLITNVPSRTVGNPFEAGDKLLFNCLVRNGSIELLTDYTTLSGTDSVAPSNFFTQAGIETSGVVNSANNSNVYAIMSSETTRGSVSTYKASGDAGYIQNGNGAAFVRMAITVA